MESQLQENQPSDTTLLDRNYVLHLLEESARWAHYLSVFGFVYIGLLLISATSIQVLPNYPSSAKGPVIFAYVLITILYFIPNLYLYQFATKLKAAVKNKDENYLVLAFERQKSMYKFIAIMTLVGLIIMALSIMLMLAALLF